MLQMETDSEIDGDLARVLSCMGTNDKEVLVKQFQQILGDHSLTPEACHFFLDMSNWNLQTALGNYYDYGAANNVSGLFEAAALNMQFVRDVTIGEGEAIPPNTRFTKTWRVRNNGLVVWPAGSIIAFMEGAELALETHVAVPSIEPGDEVDISVDMIAPAQSGIYQSRWHLNTFQRVPFGESIWCIITVDQNGIMDITQQLASAPLADRNHGRSLFGSSSPMLMDGTSNPFQLGPSRDGDENMEDDVIILPQQAKHFSETSFTRSPPIQIQNGGDTPHVPPCTPCTPPADSNP